MGGLLTNFSRILEFAKRYWAYTFLGIFVVNSLIIDFLFFFPHKPLSKNNSSLGVVNVLNSSVNYCPQSCVDQISALSQKTGLVSPVANTEKSVIPTLFPTLTSTPSSTPTPVSAKIVKEFFVPFGAGSGSSSDWKVVDGMGAKIDPADYGSIKSVTFEATVRIPNGNQQVWVRLYNANTYQMVVGSELTLSSGTPTLLISQPISLASGDNLYQIQMKTQLQSLANVDMARLRIKTN